MFTKGTEVVLNGYYLHVPCSYASDGAYERIGLGSLVSRAGAAATLRAHGYSKQWQVRPVTATLVRRRVTRATMYVVSH